MRASRLWSLPVAAALLAGLAAGCAQSGGTAPSGSSARPAAAGSTTPARPGGVSPGHATPQAAVEGFVTAGLAGDLPRSCSYLPPSTEGSCLTAGKTERLTGHVTVAGAVISGDFALVEATGMLCTSATACSSNSRPTAGLPTSSESFQRAYGRALYLTNALSPVPCVRENGQWYVEVSS